MLSILILKLLVGFRHEREEEGSGHAHSDPLYEDKVGLEGDKNGKTSLTPL